MKQDPLKREIAFALRQSPIGWLGVAAGEEGLLTITCRSFPEETRAALLALFPRAVEESGPLREALTQMEEYFRGERRTFDLLLDFGGLSPFTTLILQRLKELGFGERITYGGLAALAGKPGAARAVGMAMALNPFPIVIPCHRVVGAGGKLTGYSGGEGIATKKWLLEFEEP